MIQTADEPRRILPVVIGIAITAVALILIATLAQMRRGEEALVPELHIVAPGNDQVVDSPLIVRFQSERPLTQNSMGLGYQQLHLHAWINDAQKMAAAADMQQVADDTYTWVLRDADRGVIAIRLGWADAAHRPISAGTSQTVSAVLR